MDAREIQKKYFLYIKLPKYIEFSGYIFLGILLLVLIYYRIVYHGFLELGDSFQWESWLYRIGRGEVPYRDFFMLYGFFLPYLFFLPFKLFGGDFLAWNIVCYGILPLISYGLAVFIAKKLYTTWPMRILFLIIASLVNNYGLFFQQPWDLRVWMGLALLLIIFGNCRRKYFWAGFWIILMFFSSVDQGMYLLGTAGILGVLFGLDKLGRLGKLREWRGNRDLRGEIGEDRGGIEEFKGGLKEFKEEKRILREGVWGAGIVFGIISLIFLALGLFQPFFSFTFGLLPKMELARGGLIFPEWSVANLRYFLPPIVYFLSFLWLLKEYIIQRKLHYQVIFLTVYGIFLFRTVLGRSDAEHLSFATIPFVILTLWYLERAITGIPSWLEKEKNLTISGIKITAILVFLGVSIGYLFSTRSEVQPSFLSFSHFSTVTDQRYAMTYVPALRVYVYNGQEKGLTETLDFLKQNTAEKFYQHGWIFGLYFLTNRRNFTYFDYDGWATIEQQKEIVRVLEKKKNKYIVTNTSYALFKNSLMDDYINKYYSESKKMQEITMFERNKIPYNESFTEEGFLGQLRSEWKNVSELFTNDLVNVLLGKHTFLFEQQVNDVEMSKVVMNIQPDYFPLTSLLAKTKAVLYCQESGSFKWYRIESDFPFITDSSVDPVTFHFPAPLKVRALRVEFSSPGSFNPGPLNVNIEKTALYR